MASSEVDCPKVAVCQMTSGNNVKKNLEACKYLIKQAKQQGAVMAFLPEACDYIAESENETLLLSASYETSVLPTFKRLASKYDIWISLGGVHEPWSNEKVRNTHVIINSSGDVVARYHKLHVFDANLTNTLCESKYVEKGREFTAPIKTPIGNLGLSICYDLRFPEVGISLTEMGADVLTYPSAFTYETGSMHWETLLRARAIENQRYVIAAAQCGSHNKNRKSWGHSMIVDPFGNISAECIEETGVATAPINLKLSDIAYSKIPVYLHRRYDIYPKLTSRQISDYPENCYQFGPVSIHSDFVFYKTHLSIAFVNIRCVVPGHVLVAPIRCVTKLDKLNCAEVSDLFLTVQKVQIVMEKVHKTGSSTIALQDGPEAGQTIPHVHVHILPRKKDDFADNDDIYRILEKHDKQGSPMEVSKRTDKEMKDECNLLKSHFNF